MLSNVLSFAESAMNMQVLTHVRVNSCLYVHGNVREMIQNSSRFLTAQVTHNSTALLFHFQILGERGNTDLYIYNNKWSMINRLSGFVVSSQLRVTL